MAPPTPSDGADEKDEASSQVREDDQYLAHTGWKVLFGFTSRSHLPILSCGMLGAGVAAATIPVFAVIYGLIFRDYTDYGAGKIDCSALRSSVTRYCLILTGVAALNWLANSFYFFFFLTFGELQARSARNKIFDALIRKDMAWYDTRETGIAAFLPGIQMYIRDLQLSLSAPFGEGTQCAIQGLATLGVAFYYCWNLTFVILCTVPLIYLLESYISHWLSIRANQQANKLHLALKYITNAIQSIETVKCFNGEKYELQIFTKITGLAADIYLGVTHLRSIQIGAMQFFTVSVFVQGFWYGSHLVKSGDRNVGQVITTFWASLLAIQGITGFLPQVIVLQKGKAAGGRLQLVMKQISTNDQSQETEGELRPSRCLGDIEFRKVTFSYPTRLEEIAIRDISLFFPAGETTFVIGTSGSGKSTLGQLLVRFYQPGSGQIFLDGHALSELDIHWLRQNVTLVEQRSILFDNTIRDNIALGKPGDSVSLQEIEEAVKFAMLDSTVQGLPLGLDTELDMKGSSLSGGQRQRMALARAKIRNTPVLILDESTSALDYITRAAILQAIRDWRKGKTTIVITHDISQIQPNEFLYLMKDSGVVQEGYRKELEAQSGAFHDLLVEHEEAEEAASDVDSYSEGEDETDDIISLYDETSWHLNSPMHRPMSAVLFGENVLSPFLKSDKESFAGNVIAGLEKRFSKQETTRGNDPESSTGDSTPTGLKMAPGIAYSNPGVLQLHERSSRTASMASQQKRLSGVISYNRPMSMSLDHGSRPVSLNASALAARKNSLPGSHPTSRKNSQPNSYPTSRRSSRPNSDPRFSTNSQAIQKHKLSKREKIRSKMGLYRPKDHVKGDASNSSLPIMEILKSVWPELNWPSCVQLISAVVCAVVHAACTPAFAYVFAKLLTTFYTTENQSKRSLIYAMAILGLAFVDGIVTYLLFYLSDAVAQAWAHSLKVEAMRRILVQPREFFDRQENSISRLAETLDHFAEEARNLPGRFSALLTVILLMICISITWSMVTSWQLSLVALACGPVLFGITKCYNMISARWERLANLADDEVGQVLHETFVNIRTVRCLNLEAHFRQKYKEATTAAVNVGIKRALYSGSIFGLSFAGILFVAVLLFYYGAVLVSNNQYTVSQITETFLILMLSVNQVAYMGHYITQVNMSRDAGSRLLRLARMPTTSHELEGTVQIQEAGNIVFNKVNFTYPTRKEIQVLHDVSFEIPHGSCTAIVGSSGSGKSTVASLLLKLYQTDKNIFNSTPTPDLLVSGTDIKTLHTTTLRSRMAIVSQSPIIFPGTIAENIAYGLDPSSPLATMDSIRAAADAAGVSDFIDSLPNGYATLIGEGGTGLSGGQAQRLAIARALVRSPDILILDEATSALDVASAGIVRDTIRSLVRTNPISPTSPSFLARSRSGGVFDRTALLRGSLAARAAKGKEPQRVMTVIIITHAREMMAIAEHIVMLDKGRVVEQGRWGELKRRKEGPFARLLRGEREVL